MMVKMRLKAKLVLGCLVISTFVLTASAVVITYQARKQNWAESRELLKRAFEIVADDIGIRREVLLSGARQLASQDGMASKLGFVMSYKSSTDGSFTGKTYTEIARNTMRTGLNANAWRVSVYDMEGDLVSFAVIENDSGALGYVSQYPQAVYQVADHDPGDAQKKEAWKEAKSFNGIIQSIGKNGPDREAIRFEQVDRYLCLTGYVPVMGEVYNKESGKLEPKQVGSVIVVQKLNEAFVNRITALSGAEVNLFVKNAFCAGRLTAYTRPQFESAGKAHEKLSHNLGTLILNDIRVGKDEYFQAVLPIGESSGQIVGAIAALYSKHLSRANLLQTLQMLLFVSLGCIVLMLPLAILFSNSVARPIKHAIEGLTEIAGRVSMVTSDVSSSSRQVADGSTRQATAIEQTSASMEEITAMIRQNAQSAVQADSLMKRADHVVAQANNSMADLINNVERVSQAGQETFRIVKTIDDIAFQTNLLALNAAVEAARAGEVGSGFSVVASEVRNLSLRAAEAARSTASLIEETMRQVTQGADLATRTNEAFHEVAQSTTEIGKLFGEISVTSQEQALGIEQITKAVSEVDLVTQQNATKSQEWASASHQLSSDVTQMKELVDDLDSLI